MNTNWSKENLSKIVSESKTQKEVLMRMNLRFGGSNFLTLKKYISLYGISISHFRPSYATMVFGKEKTPLSDILVENSEFSRTHLKNRLYNEGILERKCSLCGQDENWNGTRISLILDHINGIYNDNRIENLRIVCPNCNAGLETFAGRNLKIKKRICSCGSKKNPTSEFCIKCCAINRRVVERPSIGELISEVENFGYSAIGRKYGVSDNAIRKWIKNN